jgi:SAICAR synthetase
LCYRAYLSNLILISCSTPLGSLLNFQVDDHADSRACQLPRLTTMTTAVLINSNIPNLKLLSKGKVRDIYATSSPEYLLFVASDRISAYDVIMKNVKNSSSPSPIPSPYQYSHSSSTFYLTSMTMTNVLRVAIKGHSGQGSCPDGTFALLVRQAEKHRSEPRRDFAH